MEKFNLKETKKEFAQIDRTNFIFERQILRIKHFYQNAIFKKDNDYIKLFENRNFWLKELNIEETQRIKGYQYFRKNYLKYNGTLRNNKWIKFSNYVLDILKHIKFDNCDFKFCGFVIISNGIMNFIEPIYKCEIKFNYQIKSFKYFHFNGIDYEMTYSRNHYLEGNNILFIKDYI